MIMVSFFTFAGGSSESDMGASLSLELKLLWCRIRRLRRVESTGAAALLSRDEPPAAMSVFGGSFKSNMHVTIFYRVKLGCTNI